MGGGGQVGKAFREMVNTKYKKKKTQNYKKLNWSFLYGILSKIDVAF